MTCHTCEIELVEKKNTLYKTMPVGRNRELVAIIENVPMLICEQCGCMVILPEIEERIFEIMSELLATMGSGEYTVDFETFGKEEPITPTEEPTDVEFAEVEEVN